MSSSSDKPPLNNLFTAYAPAAAEAALLPNPEPEGIPFVRISPTPFFIPKARSVSFAAIPAVFLSGSFDMS